MVVSRCGWRIARLLCCLPLAVAVWLSGGHAQILDRVLAMVAGEVILASDVRAFLDLGLYERGLWGMPEPEAAAREAAALDRLIERRIALDEVNRFRQAAPSAAEVERYLDGVRARFADPEAFAAVLAAVGLDLEDLRQILRDDIRIEAYVAERLGGRADVVEEWLSGLLRRAEAMRTDPPGPPR